MKNSNGNARRLLYRSSSARRIRVGAGAAAAATPTADSKSGGGPLAQQSLIAGGAAGRAPPVGGAQQQQQQQQSASGKQDSRSPMESKEQQLKLLTSGQQQASGGAAATTNSNNNRQSHNSPSEFGGSSSGGFTYFSGEYCATYIYISRPPLSAAPPWLRLAAGGRASSRFQPTVNCFARRVSLSQMRRPSYRISRDSPAPPPPGACRSLGFSLGWRAHSLERQQPRSVGRFATVCHWLGLSGWPAGRACQRQIWGRLRAERAAEMTEARVAFLARLASSR